MNLPNTSEALEKLAASHGIHIKPESVSFRNIGLDFLVAFAKSIDGKDWVLRIPRRADVIEKSKHETQILGFLKKNFPIKVPDWEVQSDELIAYQLLPGTPGLTVDETTYQPTWHVDPKSPVFIESFGEAVAALHILDTNAAEKAGLKKLSPKDVREKHRGNIEKVRRELGIPDQLFGQLQTWINDDSFWPPFSVVIHGDLYAAHVVTDTDGRITGMLDWTESVVGDPAQDFAYQLMTFGDDGFDTFLSAYRRAGGRIWPLVKEHCRQIMALGPITYAIYALTTQNEEHLTAAKKQLGLLP